MRVWVVCACAWCSFGCCTCVCSYLHPSHRWSCVIVRFFLHRAMVNKKIDPDEEEDDKKQDQVQCPACSLPSGQSSSHPPHPPNAHPHPRLRGTLPTTSQECVWCGPTRVLEAALALSQLSYPHPNPCTLLVPLPPPWPCGFTEAHHVPPATHSQVDFSGAGGLHVWRPGTLCARHNPLPWLVAALAGCGCLRNCGCVCVSLCLLCELCVSTVSVLYA
jgi:hypothetical protein